MERSTAIRFALAAIAIAAVVGVLAWLASVGEVAAPAATAPDPHRDAAAPGAGLVAADAAATPPDATRTLAGAASADASAPRATLHVHAIDEQDAPVAGATIWLATSRLHLDELHANATLPRAVTDAAGNATFAGLAPGQYRIHADHDTLVYSYQQQQEGDAAAIAPRVPETSAVTIRFATPYVAAVRVDGAEFWCAFQGTDAPFTGTSNGDGQDAMRRVEARVKERFPDAQTMVMLRQRESEITRKRREEALQSGRRTGYEATVWVAGRAPWTGPIELVPWPLFERPLTLALSDLPLADWATLVVHLRDALGAPLAAGVTVRSAGFPVSGKFAGLAVRDGIPLEVPAGTYELATDDLLVQALVRRTGRFSALARGHLELHVGQEHVWSRCRFVAVGGPASPASLSVDSADTGLHGMRLVPSPTAGCECWVPEGRVVSAFTVKDPASGNDWRAQSTIIATGGTVANPQVVVHRLQQH